MGNNFMAIQAFHGDAGATVWWTLAGNVRLDKLREAWLAEGLDAHLLPDEPSPEQKLGRAVRSVGDNRTLARPLARRGHWAIVREAVAGEGTMAWLEHKQELTVRIPNGGTLPQFIGGEGDLEAHIQHAFDAQHGLLDRDDVALWLVKVLSNTLYATPLRQRGGLYYVLPNRVDLWRKVAAAVEAAEAGSCYTLPTVSGDEATRAVLDALVHDVRSEADKYNDLITTGTQGKRALRARVEDCNFLLEKLNQYEGLLGGALQAVRDRVQGVQDAALAAAFVVEAGEESSQNNP